jgi:hypothetical protein
LALPAFSTPAPSTAFCAPIWLMTWPKRQAQLGQALLRDLDEQLLRLHTEDLHLGHVLDLQQRLAHASGMLAQLLAAEAVGGQRVDGAVDIAELVVEHGALHALRQRAAHVADLLAHLVPEVRHVLGRRVVLQLEDRQRLARLGVRTDLVRMAHLLQRLLDLVGDLVGHLLRGGTGPEGLDDHGAEGERRVFVLAELEIGHEAHQHQHHHQIAGQRRVLQRPARHIETADMGRLGDRGGHAGPRFSARRPRQRAAGSRPWRGAARSA